MLADDVRAASNAGGVFSAALRWIEGLSDVARFYVGLCRKLASSGLDASVFIRSLNGEAGMVVDISGASAPIAPRLVQLFDIGADGRVHGAFSVSAPAKLSACRSSA